MLNEKHSAGALFVPEGLSIPECFCISGVFVLLKVHYVKKSVKILLFYRTVLRWCPVLVILDITNITYIRAQEETVL